MTCAPGAPRLYGAKAAGLAVLIAAFALLLLIIMLRVLIGPFEFLSGGKTPAVTAVRLWEPASAAADPEWKKVQRFEAWRGVMPAAVELEVTGELGTEQHAVVVVDDAARLTLAEIAQLTRHVEAGGGAVLAGWVGAHGASGPGEHMQALLRVDKVETIPDDQAFFVAAGQHGPLSAGLAPGERAGLAGRLISPAIADPRAELYWSSWALHPLEPASGAALRVERGAGRLVWIAVEPTRAGDAHAKAMLGRLYANAVAWAGGEPTSELLAWPDAAPFAGLLAMDTEEAFANASKVARRAQADGFPITFLLLSSVAQRYTNVVAEMAAAGEVGSHADVHDGFRDQPPQQQRERLERTRAQLAEVGIASPAGLRPPYESYDAATLRALADTGFEYMLGDSDHRGMAPILVQPDGAARSLVQMPRAAADDYDLFVRRALEDPEQLRAALGADIERSEQLGGLYYLSFHTQFMDRPDRIDSLAWVAGELRRRGAWMPSAGEIARWWRQRAQIELAVTRAGAHRLRIQISNRGEQAVQGLALRVYPNAPIAGARVSSAIIFQRAPSAQLHGDGEFIDLLLPELPGGASRDYALDLEPQA